MPEPLAAKARQPNRYETIISRVFKLNFKAGLAEFEFTRDEFVAIAKT